MKSAVWKSLLLAVLLVPALGATVARADVKIKTRSTTKHPAGESSSVSTIYIKGARQRTESEGGDGADILQCDLKRQLDLNDREHTYTVTSLLADLDAGAGGASVQASASQPAAGAPRRGGVITYTVTTTDLHETKVMFGLTARHLKSVTVIESSADACTPVKQRIETDGWYANFNAELSCYQAYGMAMSRKFARPDCQDRYVHKTVGPARTGYPLQETTTIEMMGRSFTSTNEVIELSSAPLSAALFDVPTGYREVKEATRPGMDAETAKALAEAQAAMSNGGDDNNGSGASGTGAGSGNRPQPGMSAGNMAASAPALGPKRPGVIRVGVVMPKATAGEGVSPTALAEGVRNSLLSTLKSPSVEVVALEARQSAQIETEAQGKECDYVLYTSVTHKKGGGGGGLGGFLRKAAPVVDVLPMGGGTSAVVAETAASTAVYTAAAVANSIKAKDELTLDYRLTTANDTSTPVATKSFKGKAKSDGEDVLTPLVAQEASAVLADTTKK